MFKRRKRELTTEDAPDSIEPWEMLHEDEVAGMTEKLKKRYPTLTAFAKRLDNGAMACFDKGPDGTAKGVVVINQEHTERKYFPNFSAWFDAALAESRE
jgi:hypothetical protein